MELQQRHALAELELKRLTRENDLLRYLLAKSEEPCVYCSLKKADMNRCASGFPGCGRADDLMYDPRSHPAAAK
jgi:hypothetical protein